METHSLLTSGTSAEVAYTAKRKVTVHSIIVVNTHSSAVTYRVWIDPEGKGQADKNLLQPSKSLAATTKEELLADSTIYLEASGTISVQDDTGSKISIHVSFR